MVKKEIKSKKILILNWKDIKHPKTGGAEVISHNLAKKMLQNGYEVTLLTTRYKGSKEIDEIDKIKIIRVGNLVTHYPLAILYYLKNLRNQFDIIIEEVNTVPYFFSFFKDKEKIVLYYNMLAREIWFYEFFQPISTIGYLVEPIYTFIQSRFNNLVLTISESSKKDLVRFGFKADRIKIFSMWIENSSIKSLKESKPKEDKFTILFHGSLRNMKRPILVFKAYKEFLNILTKNSTDTLNSQLWVSGSGDKKELEKYALKNNFLENTSFFGRTSEEKKLELMQKATVLAVSSLKEGWGLVVTEANSMGTPSIVVDVDGLRDSGRKGGNFVVKNDFKEMAKKFYDLYILFNDDKEAYEKIRQSALDSSKELTIEKGYQEFMVLD